MKFIDDKAGKPVGINKYIGRAYFQQVIGRLKEEGCGAVILGCTEIPLIMSDTNSPLPTLDSTRLLARAALQRTVGHAPKAGLSS